MTDWVEVTVIIGSLIAGGLIGWGLAVLCGLAVLPMIIGCVFAVAVGLVWGMLL